MGLQTTWTSKRGWQTETQTISTIYFLHNERRNKTNERAKSFNLGHLIYFRTFPMESRKHVSHTLRHHIRFTKISDSFFILTATCFINTSTLTWKSLAISHCIDFRTTRFCPNRKQQKQVWLAPKALTMFCGLRRNPQQFADRWTSPLKICQTSHGLNLFPQHNKKPRSKAMIEQHK